MSSLTPKEKQDFEELFDMSGGYVLGFSDSTFGNFFYAFDVDIHSEVYQLAGGSKAKKLREFWRIESDELVGTVLYALIEKAEASPIQLDYFTPSPVDEKKKIEREQRIERCKQIAQRLCSSRLPLTSLKQTTVRFDSQYIARQICRMEDAINPDPALAIGTAKELLETCCKTILEERGKPLSNNADLSELTKATFKELRLLPENISDSQKASGTIKRLLSNLSTISVGLAELRNSYGTGHGKKAQAQGLKPRHAKLAVGSSATLVTFLYDTHLETKGANS